MKKIEVHIKLTYALDSPIVEKSKFLSQFSKIKIRGLGATDTQNQIDQLIYWLGLFVNEINNFEKNTPVKEI